MFPINKDLQRQQNHIVVAMHAFLHSSVRSLWPWSPLYYTHTNTSRQPALLSPSYRAGAEFPLKGDTDQMVRADAMALAPARVLLLAVLTGKASCMHECNNLPSTRKYLTYVLRRLCVLGSGFPGDAVAVGVGHAVRADRADGAVRPEGRDDEPRVLGRVPRPRVPRRPVRVRRCRHQ
jgi:hypothetical protein